MSTRSKLALQGAAAAVWLASALNAHAGENLAGLGHLSEHASDTAELSLDSDRWAAVSSDNISLVNAAPVLLPYFNNAPVFGIPGTVTGSVTKRTQLTDDWGGRRSELARRGYFLDWYTTSTYQDIREGGLEEGDSFVQSSQLSFNVDTGRAGWWDSGLLHVTLQSRDGDEPHETFTAGTSVPQYTGLVFPGPILYDDTYFTEYVLTQALNEHVTVIGGKISNIFVPDQTLMADSYKYYFSNFAFNKNPITPNFYNPTSLAVLAAWAPSPKFALAGGVLDPYTEVDSFATDESFDDVNVYVTTVSTYSVRGLPGQFSPAINWTNKAKVDLESPYGALTPAQVPAAIGQLLGVPAGLATNHRDESWFAIANFSQYLWLKDAPESIRGKLKSGQVLNGLGLIGRIGYAPERTNPIARDASLALFGHGLVSRRPYDSFGVGYYYNGISDDLEESIERLTGGTRNVSDEKGVEVFYNLAITPAIRLIASYQHVRDPLIAQVAADKDVAKVLLVRLNIAY